MLREDAVLGISDGHELVGRRPVLAARPGGPAELDLLGERTWAALGAETRARFDDCVRAWESTGVDEPNIHVNMLAVVPDRQGRGLARALLERVQAMSRERADSQGVTLSTENERNVALYRHLGYRVVGRRRSRRGWRLGISSVRTARRSGCSASAGTALPPVAAVRFVV